MARRKVLVTGACGFIGAHLVRRLARDPDCDIVMLDNMSRGDRDAEIEALLDFANVDLVCRNLRNVEMVGDFDEIYHLAATNGTRRFYEEPYEVISNNIALTAKVIELAREMEPLPRVLFTSSNEAYAGGLEAFGQLPIPTPERVPLVVSDPYNPRWSYGASKLAGEVMMIAAAKQYGIPVVIARPHNFYGPRAGTEHVIPGLIRKILRKDDPITVPGSDETRSFCYITDAVEALVQLMPMASIDAPTYHVGSTEEITIRHLAKMLLEVTGYEPIGGLECVPGLPGSVLRRCPDVSKIWTEIGWDASTPLKVGLAETVRWYQMKQ